MLEDTKSERYVPSGVLGLLSSVVWGLGASVGFQGFGFNAWGFTFRSA